MNSVCGADGCKNGWVAIFKDVETGAVSWEVCRNVADIAAHNPSPQVVAIDIPIGLPDRGPRLCDLEARKLLNPYRGSSVFPAPIRPVISCNTYVEACEAWYRAEGKKMSRQGWAIVPKVREVDEFMRSAPESRDKLREIHPEVCFYFLAGGRPMRDTKKSLPGLTERLGLLEPHFDNSLRVALQDRRRLQCNDDDILDAFVALWTAERILKGTAQSVPNDPPCDCYGFRMEMLA